VTDADGERIEGTVTTFDESRGRGVVTSASGETYEFHATRIADGSRRIAVGSAVRFAVVPALLGRWEASDITRA
jgi:cold shock CspA family protein